MESLTATQSFTKVRTHLALLYTSVLLCIVLAFSIFLYLAQNNDYRRIVLRQDFGKTVPRRLTLFQKRVVVRQVQELRKSFLYELIIIDSALLLIEGVLSYFFAGKTMKPVGIALANQENFLADASHELRTPLAAIQTAIEVTLRKQQKPEVYKETLVEVKDEVERMHHLLEELLLLSRVDMNQFTFAMDKVSLTQITRKTVREIKPLLQKHGLDVRENLENEVVAMGNEERIKQVLLILLDNARKYTPKGGIVSVSVISKPQPHLIVQDTGKGIPIEKQKDIFKRFYQAENSHTGHGAGLGLAIAQSIMKLHKGKITVDSTTGKGSTFTCFFQFK